MLHETTLTKGITSLHLLINDFRGAMAYWLASQEINSGIDINKPLDAFTKYISNIYFKDNKIGVAVITVEELSNILTEDNLAQIP